MSDHAKDYAQLHRGVDGQFYFAVKSGGNHETIAQSEGYHRKADALEALRAHFPQVTIVVLDQCAEDDDGA